MPLNENDIPNKQSALVLQGGGALGAYEAGALTVLCKELTYEYREGPLYDIVAGTSIGAYIQIRVRKNFDRTFGGNILLFFGYKSQYTADKC
jgi:patatin-like phospholipase/acyl hydrolase